MTYQTDKSELMPGPVLITVSVEQTLAAINPGPEAAGLVALARLYALAIADAGGSQNSIKELGPKLATVLVALGAGKPGSAAALPAPAAEPTPDPVAVEVAAARAPEGSPESELDAMRRRRASREGRPA